MSEPPPRAAAFDLGTNTFLALVAERDAQGGLRVLGDEFRTPRLGEGLARSGRIDPLAFERGLAALRELCAFVAGLAGPRCAVRAVGTAVFRRAANAQAFIDAARRELGLSIEVVSGAEEGALSYTAAASALAGRAHDALVTASEIAVIDVGGGSTELAWERAERRESVALGALVLTEQHLGSQREEAWSDAAWALARAEVLAAFSRVEVPLAAGARSVVVLGGTGANLAALEHGFQRFEPRRTEGRLLTRAGAGTWAERLSVLAVRERCALPIEASRAAILPAGLLCLEAALRALRVDRAQASGRGLRYGLAWKILQNR